jgi:hypothetical protein
MDEHDIIKILGFPDEIVRGSKTMTSPLWRCDSCDRHYDFAKPVTIPAPCYACGGIAFTALDEVNEDHDA